jgi:hypothetical protein
MLNSDAKHIDRLKLLLLTIKLGLLLYKAYSLKSLINPGIKLTKGSRQEIVDSVCF